MLSRGIGDARESLHDDVGRERSTFAQEVSDFSLVLGGSLFQFLRKFHLQGNAMQLLHRQVFASILLAWFPLPVLSAFGNPDWRCRSNFVPPRHRSACSISCRARSALNSSVRAVGPDRPLYRVADCTARDMPLFDKAIACVVKVRESISVALHERQHHGGVQDLC